MIEVPDRLWVKFERYLLNDAVAEKMKQAYKKWLLYYLDFCKLNRHDFASEASITPFLEKLKAKRQCPVQLEQAARSVEIYRRMVRDANAERTRMKRRTVDEVAEAPSAKPSGSERSMAGKKRDPDNHDHENDRHPKVEEGASWVNGFTQLKNNLKMRHY